MIRCYVCAGPLKDAVDWKFGPSCGKPKGHAAMVCGSCVWGADMYLTRQRAARLKGSHVKRGR